MNLKSLLTYKLVAGLFFLVTFSDLSQPDNVRRVNIVNPSIGYEKAIGNTTTVETAIGYGIMPSYSGDHEIAFNPSVQS